MGAVFLGVDEHTGDEVAIKVVRNELTSSEEALARFRREVRALASLDSPRIVTAHDAGTVDGMPYLVMERLRGTGLDELVASGQVAPRRAIAIVIELLEGLVDAHAAGVIHRDLKPSNIWLTDDDHVKILDFGVAKMVDASQMAGEDEGKLTGTGAVLGSPAYMSPEQLISSKEADERADIWSVGVLLYELLTGLVLFEAETVGGIFANVIRMPIPLLGEVLPGASPELEQLVGHCLEREPECRLDSAKALSDALSRVYEAEVRGEQMLVGAGSTGPVSRAAQRGTLSDAPTLLLPQTPGLGVESDGAWRSWALGASLATLVGLVVFAIVLADDTNAPSAGASSEPDDGATAVALDAKSSPDHGEEPPPVADAGPAPSATSGATSTAPVPSSPASDEPSRPSRLRPSIPRPPASSSAPASPDDERWESRQ